MTITPQTIGTALTMIAQLEPGVLAAYTLARSIWLSVSPGKTEADFLAALQAASTHLVQDSDAILIANGYHQDPSGAWVKT